MARWQPDAQGRLRDAALALFGEQGYGRTTAAEIAERAGLKERSFFRYFADKRDVFFVGQDDFAAMVARAVTGAQADLPPLDAVVAGFATVTAWFDERRDLARARKDVIDADPELQERERTKLAGFGAALADALRGRGVPEPEAVLAGEAGVAVWRLAFAHWLAGRDELGLERHIRTAAEDLRRVVTPGRPTT